MCQLCEFNTVCSVHAGVSVSCQVILVSANKLTRYIEPCQLTDDFGGSLDYDHSDWLNKRLVSILLNFNHIFDLLNLNFIFLLLKKNASCHSNQATCHVYVICYRSLRSSPRSRRHCWTSCRLSMKVTRAAQWTRTSMHTHTHTQIFKVY